MDLALELGQPVRSLARSMTEQDFRAWQRYAARRMLPQRRIELYLAQIALTVASALGGATDKTLSDFMLEPEDTDDHATEDGNEAVAFFGFSPRPKG